MNLFEQVKPIEEIKEDKKDKKVKKVKKDKKSNKNISSPQNKKFNDLESVEEIKPKRKSKVKKHKNEYYFDPYKDNIFSLYLNCEKIISQKPYFAFNEKKDLFLSNDKFNDFFDIQNNKLILNIDDYNVISYIVNNFIEELSNIDYIQVFQKNIPKKYFLNNLNNSNNLNNKFKIKERRCEICPFFDLEKCIL